MIVTIERGGGGRSFVSESEKKQKKKKPFGVNAIVVIKTNRNNQSRGPIHEMLSFVSRFDVSGYASVRPEAVKTKCFFFFVFFVFRRIYLLMNRTS